MTAPTDWDAAILVGHARRLPKKFDLEWNGSTLLEHVVDRVTEAGFRPMIVAVSSTAGAGLPLVPDRYDRGPLGAVRSVLEAGYPRFLLVGGDMPRLDADSLRRLRAMHAPGVSIVPRWRDGAFEVLHGIYDLDLAEVVRAWSSGRALRDLVRAGVESGTVRAVPAEEFPAATFTDVDTPEDLERLRGSDRPADD